MQDECATLIVSLVHARLYGCEDIRFNHRRPCFPLPPLPTSQAPSTRRPDTSAVGQMTSQLLHLMSLIGLSPMPTNRCGGSRQHSRSLLEHRLGHRVCDSVRLPRKVDFQRLMSYLLEQVLEGRYEGSSCSEEQGAHCYTECQHCLRRRNFCFWPAPMASSGRSISGFLDPTRRVAYNKGSLHRPAVPSVP